MGRVRTGIFAEDVGEGCWDGSLSASDVIGSLVKRIKHAKNRGCSRASVSSTCGTRLCLCRCNNTTTPTLSPHAPNFSTIFLLFYANAWYFDSGALVY